jgi:hypothetical protein
VCIAGDGLCSLASDYMCILCRSHATENFTYFRLMVAVSCAIWSLKTSFNSLF